MMTYDKRAHGRGFDELREITAKVGVIPRADGSAYFKIGGTAAYAAVYGPRNLFPRFLQNPETGILRCHYNMMPFSGKGDRVRPGGSRRSKEISLVTEKAITPVLNLRDYPNSVVDVFIELPETAAGSRCAGICAASMALADAGLDMKDLVAAVSVGKVGDKVVVDINSEEEAYEEGSVDIPIAMLPSSGKITLLQMDGELKKEDLMQALEKGKKALQKICEIQKNALKEKYKVEQNE
ncbi:exosome complex exonuclease Rrp41 [Candidatus Woesearchaeota archaeon]|nr:exosome complex exonuclease Rrp41 [Candidatus Woesearchaeota archaeon]